MNQKIAILLLTLLLGLQLVQAQKGAAVVDIVNIDLKANETKQFNKTLQTHQELALMVNIQMASTGQAFGQFELSIFNENKDEVSCSFIYLNNLCVLQKSTSNIILKIECIAQTCKANLMISQRMLYQFDDKGWHKSKSITVPGEILKLQKQQQNTIVEVTSEMGEDLLRSSDVGMYSNVHAFRLSEVEEIGVNSAVFGLKPITKNNHQYIYIEGSSIMSRMQLTVHIKTHEGKIKEGMTVVDFIQTYNHHAINTYEYYGEFDKNIQISTRIFATFDSSNIPFGIVVEGRRNFKQKKVVISELHIDKIYFEDQNIQDVVLLVSKSLHSEFKMISFNLVIDKMENRTIFMQFQVNDVDSAQIDIFDNVYFATNKGEALKFYVSPDIKYTIEGKDMEIPIKVKVEQKYFPNITTCSLHSGCQIEIRAEQKCDVCSFNFDLKDSDVKNHLIFYQINDSVIRAKVDYEEQIFFKRVMEPHKVSQIIANTPNIMIYAQFEGYAKCKLPNAGCHQYAISKQNPMKLSNNQNSSQKLIIGIVGLQKTDFLVKFVDQEGGLSVKLNQRFVYLFDDDQNDQIQIKFKVNQNTFTNDTSKLYFNLVAPTNALQMTVSNLDGNTHQANDGFIEFSRNDLGGEQFFIKIKKMPKIKNHFVRMTLLVTNTQSTVILDPTTTHYQKYAPSGLKKFIFEYDPNQKNLINIYTQNLEKQHGKMLIIIQEQNMGDKSTIIQKTIQRDTEVLDLDFQLQNLDACQQINCELQLTILNLSKQQFQQSITLLHEESVIMLQDSIWMSYEINQLSEGNHFYFFPWQKGKSIDILFNSQDKNLYVDYMVYTTSFSINAQDWPWEKHEASGKVDINHLTGHQQFKIAGESPQLQHCWPNCVIMISVNNAQLFAKQIDEENEQLKSYKILVSSTVVEAPEQTKFQIIMNPGEQNSMFIELKNFLKSEQFTFFTDYKIGRANVTVSLMRDNQEYNLGFKKEPFVLEDVETHLLMSSIQTVLSNQQIKLAQCSLKITFRAITTVKLYFQFLSYLKNMYRLKMDDLEVANLRQGEEVFYDFIPERDYSIKFYRGRGFPMFKVFECKQKNVGDCLDRNRKYFKLQVDKKKKIEQNTNKNKKLVQQKEKVQIVKQLPVADQELDLFVDKNYEYSKQKCDKCIVFIWVYGYSQDDVQLSINIRSSASEIELKEMAVVNDRISKSSGYIKYLINVEPDKVTRITFRVIEGLCQVQVSDSLSMLFNSSFNSLENDYRDFEIPALQLPDQNHQSSQEEQSNEQNIPNIPPVYMPTHTGQNHKILRHIHIKVKSLSQKSIDYLVSYSVGQSGVFIQDGVILKKQMSPEVGHTFFYHNRQKQSHAYFTLSSTVRSGYSTLQSNNEYLLKFYYYPDISNRQKRQQFKPEMPPKKNKNYFGQTLTHVYELPGKHELYEFEITTSNYIEFTASINHKELVYLPLGFQYLIKLHPNQKVYMVVDRPDSDYLDMSFKKCDDSVPTLFYTNDVKEFQKGKYSTQEELQNNFQRKMVETKKQSRTIHIKLLADEMGSLFTISVLAANETTRSKSRPKAGNDGYVDYINIDSTKIEVQFSPVHCGKDICDTPPQYYLLATDSLKNINGELYCSGNYFASSTDKLDHQNELISISQSDYVQSDKVFRYTLDLDAKKRYLGVKAVLFQNNKKVEIVYKPKQISTLWNQMSKISIGVFLLFSCALSLVLTIVIVVSTKMARRGYRPLAMDE